MALLDSPWLTLGALGVVLVAKPAVALAIVWAMRYPVKVSLTVAIALAQIGEFSFILVSLGREYGLLDSAATNTVVAAALVSIVINPLLYRSVGPIERWLSGHRRVWTWLNPSTDVEASASSRQARVDARHRAVIVGYGPTGRTVARLLADNSIAATVIDLNVDTVRTLREEGIDAVYGDAIRTETLAAAGVESAATLILTSAGMEHSAEVIRAARELNPKVRVLARAAYLRDLPVLRQAGADTSHSGEGEVALAFVEDILQELGATAEQIDRERERAHQELAAVHGGGESATKP
jgi:CPA2 family monovalent cation:H+ antiporter-2